MTDTTTLPIQLFNESRKRGLLLVCIYLFPLIFSSVLFLLVMIISDIDFKVVGHTSNFATIQSPNNRSQVSKKFNISGTTQTPKVDHSYYLIEYRNNLYWPKFDLGNKANSWKKELTFRAKKNNYSVFQVVMANPNVKKTIDAWFEVAKKTGKYPGIKDVEFDNVVARIRVKSL